MPDTKGKTFLKIVVALLAVYGLISFVYNLIVGRCYARTPKCSDKQKPLAGKCATKCSDDSNCKISEMCQSGLCQEAQACHNLRCEDDEGCPSHLKCVDGKCAGPK